MQQYFVEGKYSINDKYVMSKDVRHHILNVMRCRIGDTFRIVDEDKHLFMGRLINKEEIELYEKLEEDRDLKVNVTAIISLIRGDRFDFELQKLTELGVSRIVPFKSEYSTIKIDEKEEKKLERYRRIVQEAAEQSRRTSIPEITEIARLKDLDKYLSKYNYVPYEKADSLHIPYDAIDESLTYVIGPEGGISPKEIEYLESIGFKAVTLGKRILRAETAAIYVLSNVGGQNE